MKNRLVIILVPVLCAGVIFEFFMHNTVQDIEDSRTRGEVHHKDKMDKPAKIKGATGAGRKKRGQQHDVLNCSKFGGPSGDMSKMVYWNDIPSDALYKSPFCSSDGQEKYISFEPDKAGFNNIRMGVETVVALAHAMCRTLVLPPARRMWNLDRDHKSGKSSFTFDDFFPLTSLAKEHVGLNIITNEEFLSRINRGKIVFTSDNDKNEPMFPPNNQTNWDGQDHKNMKLWDYLRSVGIVRNWNADKCVAAFPQSSRQEDLESLKEMFKNVSSQHVELTYPVNVDGSSEHRLQEMISNRRELCMYDKEMQDATLVHFKEDWRTGFRLLTHFYGLIYFQDWRQDLWTKRFVRDHLRFNDEVICAAGRIVEALQRRVKKTHGKHGYNSMHVRRADFGSQFKDRVVTADQIVDIIKPEIEANSTIYIATDEQDKSYFDPLRRDHDVVFLTDFQHLLKDVNINYYSFIEQVVAARGEVFFGVHLSTYTAYTNRLRGYYSVKQKIPGYKSGIINSYHYVKPHTKNEYREYHNFVNPSFAREFPTAWRDIDYGIDQFSSI